MTATFRRTGGTAFPCEPDVSTPLDDRSSAVRADNERAPVIVVAVDGSPSSERALDWAAKHAASTGSSMRIVTAFSHPLGLGDLPLTFTDLIDDIAHNATQRAADAIDRVRDDRRSAPAFEHVVECGSIDHILQQHAADAAMIVVGTRSRRRWRERLRTSTTNRITGRIDVPIMSVPAVGPVN